MIKDCGVSPYEHLNIYIHPYMHFRQYGQCSLFLFTTHFTIDSISVFSLLKKMRFRKLSSIRMCIRFASEKMSLSCFKYINRILIEPQVVRHETRQFWLIACTHIREATHLLRWNQFCIRWRSQMTYFQRIHHWKLPVKHVNWFIHLLQNSKPFHTS